MRVAALAGKDPWRDRAAPRPLSFEAALASDTATTTSTTTTTQSLAIAARQFIACAERLAQRTVCVVLNV